MATSISCPLGRSLKMLFNMIDKISTNFALISLNMNPQIKNKVDDEDVIRTRTIFAPFDYDNCVSKLENKFGSFSFDNGEELKEYRVIMFVSIRAYGGRTYNSLSLLSVPEDDHTSQQTISGYFLHASEDKDDEILEMINENIDVFGDLSDVDEDYIESLDMDIAACETKKSFMTFYRVLLTKCPEEFASELISELDPLIEGFANRIAYRQLKKTTIQVRNLLTSLGIELDETARDMPVAELDLTDHTRKCLEIAGIENVSELTVNKKLESYLGCAYYKADQLAQLGEIFSEMESNVKRFETELNYDEVRCSLAEALAVLQDVPAVQKAPVAKKPEAKQPTAKVLELDIQRLEAVRQQARRKAVGFGYAAASVFAGLLISGAAAMLSVRRT